MKILLIIAIVLLVIYIVADIIYTITKDKYIKVMEQQNKLLNSLIVEGNKITQELIKENLRNSGGTIGE